MATHCAITGRKYWCTPCTARCTNYEKEALKQPPLSNFITHSTICKAVPVAESWASFQVARNSVESPKMGGEESATKVRGIEAQ